MRTQSVNLKSKDMSEEILKLLMSMERDIGEIKATGLSTLAQATKTNGRVTCLEESNRELSKIVSRHNGVLLKWEQNEEDSKQLRLERTRAFISMMPKALWVLLAIGLFFIFEDFPNIIDFLKALI